MSLHRTSSPYESCSLYHVLFFTLQLMFGNCSPDNIIVISPDSRKGGHILYRSCRGCGGRYSLNSPLWGLMRKLSMSGCPDSPCCTRDKSKTDSLCCLCFCDTDNICSPCFQSICMNFPYYISPMLSCEQAHL